jgi:WD40 repeat protein
MLSVAFSPDGQHIVSGSGDKSVKVSVSARKEVASLAAGYVYSVAFSPDGQHIVSGSGNGNKLVKAWSVSARN